MQRNLLAALLAGLFSLAAQAESIPSLDEIVVSATRFPQTQVREPYAVQVIDRREVERSGAATVPELLERVAGLRITPLYGAHSANIALDARGFGETGNSHVAVLLDGRRLNSLDTHGVNPWLAVPLDRIERVEVLRGSGAVLHGDNAMAAVVNLITRSPGRAEKSASLKAGSFGALEGNVALSGVGASASWSVAAQAARRDGYRRHNDSDLANVSGRVQRRLAAGDAFLDFGLSRLDTLLPGALTDAQYQADPRQADPAEAAGGSHFDRRGAWLRPGFSLRINDLWRAEAELGWEEDRSESWLAKWFSSSDNRAGTLSMTPRLRYQDGPARATLGLDWQSADFRSLRGAAPGVSNQRIDLDRRSLGLYAQADRDVTPSLTLSLGARRQNVDQDIARAAAALANDQSRTAWDVGFSQALEGGWRWFGKAGHTFRFPKVDELTTFAGLGVDLKPEHGNHVDLGLEWKRPGRRLQASVYHLGLKDEIAWNNATFQNENLDATRHRGLELDGRLDLNPDWTLAVAYAYTRARFEEGANQGRDIPLVPRHQGRLGLDWRGEAWRAGLEMRAQGRQRYGGDYDNSIAPLGGYALWNLHLEHTLGAWQARLSARNLLDRRHAALGYEDGWTAPHALYPGEGRALYLSLSWKG